MIWIWEVFIKDIDENIHQFYPTTYFATMQEAKDDLDAHVESGVISEKFDDDYEVLRVDVVMKNATGG